MGLFDKIRGFFGSSNTEQGESRSMPPSGDNRSHFWNDEDEEKFNRPYDGTQTGFNIFSDPFEMHRYFEHQMNEMLKSFGMFQESAPSFFGSFHFPAIGDTNEGYFNADDGGNSGSLREHYLKPGYEREDRKKPLERIDKDIDGRLDMGDLDSVLKGKNSHPTHKFYSFGQSVTSKTVHNPDGTIETHRTIKNSDGTEETTITKRSGDREYTVIKRRDRDGKEEIEENLLNMDENDLKNFLKVDKEPPDPPLRDPSWFNFDKYFK